MNRVILVTAAYEGQYFANLDETRADKPYNYPDHNPLNRKVAKVPGKSRGPSIMLRVMAGDTIEISAKAFYNMDKTLPGKGVDIAPIVGSAIAAMTSPVGAVLDEAAQLALDLGAEASQSVALVGLPKEDKDEYQNPQPKSGINFVAYNEKFKLVPENTGVLMVEDNIHTIQTLATDRIIIRESGFLEVYAHNEAQTPVYFDNMTVSRRAGAALEVNAYYPYGMLNPGLSNSNGDAPNAYKYNAKELQKELNLNWLDYGKRMLDPTVGRWWVPDPRAEKYYNVSPYAFALNNPIRFIDPQGDTVRLSTAFQEDEQAMKSYNEWASSKAGKRFIKDYGVGGKHENVSVVFDIADMDASGETQMWAVNKNTGEEADKLDPQRTIDKMKAEGIDVSGLRSKLGKDEYLRAKILVSGGVIDAQSIKQGGTFVHESQHVRMMHGDISKYGFIWYSGAEQHLFMKDVNKNWYKERLEYWQEKRPDYSIELINKIMNNFQYGRW